MFVETPLCYLTTACVEYKGLADDCRELETLRRFRDTYMLTNEEGKALVKEYYEVAPSIVTAINKRNDKAEIYDLIYDAVLKCVDMIENEKYAETQNLYIEMVKKVHDMVF